MDRYGYKKGIHIGLGLYSLGMFSPLPKTPCISLIILETPLYNIH